MYVAYIASFRYLKAYEVALFTIFTPLYVTLLDDAFERRIDLINLGTATLAVLGTGMASYSGLGQGALLRGALLVQLSNLFFAFGQVAYRRWMSPALGPRDLQVFALLYLGGFAAAGLSAAALTDWAALAPRPTQLLVLLYLGAVASGLGFFLWNYGARRVAVGPLAIMNDLKIPLAVAVSLLFFGERAPLGRLTAGGLLVLAALALQEWRARRRPTAPSKT
jgi:drug/metabolite transporter (DMT)-like permease